MCHYSPMDLQKKNQYYRDFSKNPCKGNLMASENTALIFTFSKKNPKRINFS